MQLMRNAAKRVLVKLNEIQPAVSTAGLEYESELISEIKKDMAQVIWGGCPTPRVVEKILDNQLVDVLSSMDAFLAALENLGNLNLMTIGRSERFDTLLRMAMLAAENFAGRTGDLLSAKESFKHIFGGPDASN